MKKLSKMSMLLVSLMLVSCGPTSNPTVDPTSSPTSDTPTVDPTSNPTSNPTVDPTVDPTSSPTIEPTVDPTSSPTVDPTVDPTTNPPVGPTVDPTTEPTTGPTVDPTVDPTTEPSTTPSVEPTVDPAVLFEEEVKETIGSKSKLVKHIKSFAGKPIITINYSTSKETAYISESETTSVMFKSHEVYANISSTEKTTTTSKTSSETHYTAMVDGVFYDANISSDATFSSVNRYIITDDIKSYEVDKITNENAEARVAAKRSLYDLTMLPEYGFWNEVLSASAKERSFNYTIYDDYVRVVLEAYSEGYTCTNHQFIVTFDYNFNILSGVLNTSKYEEAKWDATTHTPLADAKASSSSKYSLDGVEYGEPLTTGKRTMIDLTPYFTQSLNSSLFSITNWLTNPLTGVQVYSEPNTIFPNQQIECPRELIKENKAYAPDTALDIDTLYITGTSKEGFLSAGAFGWTVTGEVDDVATIYIGNAFNPKLAEFEVTIVKSPIRNVALPSSYVSILTSPEDGNYTYTTSGARPVLAVNGLSTLIVAVHTHNEGPFDEIPIAIVFTNGVAEAKLLEDQSSYYDTFSATAVYFSITMLKTGRGVMTVIDSDTNEGYYEANIVVRAS